MTDARRNPTSHMPLSSRSSVVSRVAFVWIGLALAGGAACRPSNVGGRDKAGKPASSGSIAAADASASATSVANEQLAAPPKPDTNEARRLSWQAIGCFVGGPWSEALGASGEERVLADTKRCREIAVGLLGAKPEDVKALDSVRAAEPEVIGRVITALTKKYGAEIDDKMLKLVRATGDASHEAQAVRKVAEELRKAKTKQPTDIEIATLSAKDALAAIAKVGTDEAKLVQLVLGADRVESARGLSLSTKMLTASIGFETVFGVARPKAASDVALSEWVTYLAAVAKAGGHAPKYDGPKTDEEKEQIAFTNIAKGFADRFEKLAETLAPSVAKGVANGYAARLRTQLADAAEKEKSKDSAKAPTVDPKTKPKDKDAK